ncbi:MAG TPA: sigma-70 family RNA polymerase sigma factor [Cyclobacteriaceae bacterium]|nr:sigma-70 family RNA polymerase sigma factor [Cyclobacteriaceae bacterium]
MHPEDLRLIQEYIDRQSSNACYSLVSRHQRAVFGMCFRILKNREEAEEAAQDSFLKFFDSLHKLREREKFKSWLMSIAYRTAIDRYRSRKPVLTDIDRLADTTADKNNDPQQQMQVTQKRELIEQIFEKMNPLDSSILNLYYTEDMQVKEIANVLEQTESNVKIRLMRARQVLRSKLEPLYKRELKP